MKKFICAAASLAVGISCAASFGGCNTGEAYVEYTLSEDGTYYIVSGVSGNKRGLNRYEIPSEYSVEEGGQALPVKEIGDFAFTHCDNLFKITLPSTLETIGRSAFAFCSFREVIIPSGVTHIGWGAFGACKQLKEITIPESVTTLEAFAFYSCSALETAHVNANITVLEDSVFYNSVYTQGGEQYTQTALKKVYLSASIQKIRDTALYGNFISDIYFDGTTEQWENVYFYKLTEKEGSQDEYEEEQIEKSRILEGVTVHKNDPPVQNNG